MLPNDGGPTNVRPQPPAIGGRESRDEAAARQWPDKCQANFGECQADLGCLYLAARLCSLGESMR